MAYNPRIHKPLSDDEVKEKYKEVQEEWDEVNNWFIEETKKLKEDEFKTHQAKTACKKNIEKAKKRVDSVRGTMEYWKNRTEGMSHFRASIILHEYWASLKERDESEKKNDKENPKILKKK